MNFRLLVIKTLDTNGLNGFQSLRLLLDGLGMKQGVNARSVLLPVVALSLLFSFTIYGCSTSSVEWMDPEMEDISQYLEIDEPTGDSSSEPGEGPRFGLVGDPCEADADCDTNFCMSTELLVGMGVDNIEIPFGMCSMMFCSADKDCGEGGKCVDGTAIAGVPIQLCMKGCVDSRECRYSQGYSCFDTGVPEQAAEGEEAGNIYACLPASLVLAIYCGDGICDENEKVDPTFCPLDCSYCGDGLCYDGKDDPSKEETAESCPQDCADK